MRTVQKTIDLSPILDWCNKETSSLPAIKFGSEFDDPDISAITINGAIDICNRFRSSLKPTFKAITTRINEINNEYISKNELVRDDIIYVVGKFVDGEVHLEAEDTITDGTIKARFLVQKVSEYNEVDIMMVFFFVISMFSIAFPEKSIHNIKFWKYKHLFQMLDEFLFDNLLFEFFVLYNTKENRFTC
ncbi:hypothetical protein M9Y10_042362 [Tritrichomonas musculus]|uniref:SnoaL-like domain-containing protein n=1 Tax=Tritrichomonas musculus TaxID=1915356 RepID=A0ABR2GQ02_9EUKA